MHNSSSSIKQVFFHDRRDCVAFMHAVGKTLISKVFCLEDREFIWNKPVFIFTVCFCGCASDSITK